MKNKITFILMFIVLMFSCGPKYDTNFDTPKHDASLDEVFPLKIADFERDIDKLKLDDNNLLGFQAYYGNNQIIIKVIQGKDNEIINQYFANVIVSEFDNMTTHFRGQINGKWYANGTDQNGYKWYGWVNDNWIFILSGNNEDNFNLAIDNFKFIKRKK